MSWTAPKVIPLEAPVSQISFLRDRLIPARLLIPAAAFSSHAGSVVSSGWFQDSAAFIFTSPRVGVTSGGWGRTPVQRFRRELKQDGGNPCVEAVTIHLSPLHVRRLSLPLSPPFSLRPGDHPVEEISSQSREGKYLGEKNNNENETEELLRPREASWSNPND